MQQKREIQVCVISDVHLGTYGCHARELCHYLKSIDTKKLILNGDIIDIWAFNKNYFPRDHMLVIRQLVKMAANGVEIYYVTGNHDDLLRRFSEFHLANFYLVDKLVLRADGRRAWIFHGDVFDISMKHTTTLARLGGKIYDRLIVLNRFVNLMLKKVGRQPYSFSKKIKDSVKKAVKYVNDFEYTAAVLAAEKQYDYVICGHIHQPQKRVVNTEYGDVVYLNSGDWVENLTALEYYAGDWHIYQYGVQEVPQDIFPDTELDVRGIVERITGAVLEI